MTRGKAAALAVAKSLVSDNVPKYIGVQPYVVHEKQLKRAWKDIFFEALPEELGRSRWVSSYFPNPYTSSGYGASRFLLKILPTTFPMI